MRWVVHVPAFAEEMNKCRPMVARQARRLAQQGAVVVVPDLAGTGDSDLAFDEARWQLWLQEIGALLDWSTRCGAAPPLLWGARLGCLLALQALQGGQAVAGLLLWQPVLSGAQHLNQFLRLRTAAGMMQGEAESVSELREQLAAGQDLDIAGYPLAATLFSAVSEASAAALTLAPDCPVAVHEVVAEVGKPLLPVTAKQVDAWREAGAECAPLSVAGSPFWMTQEIGFAPQLLEAGAAFVATIAPGAAPFDPASLASERADGGGGRTLACVFPCAGEELPAHVQLPAQSRDTGVVIVVGGPQYRVGSHRQFQQLASSLVSQGIPVMRFDYRGMGDGGGQLQGFMHIAQDIRCAVDSFCASVEGLQSVVLWGLCDAATACVAYAPTDARIKGLVLANPWVYSEAGEARAYLKHYYRERLFSADFWRKLLRGEFDLLASLRSMLGFVRRAGGAAEAPDSTAPADAGQDNETPQQDPSVDLGALFADGLVGYDGSLLLLISGNDLTAAQFLDTVQDNKALSRCLSGPRVQRLDLAGADHTFAERDAAAAVEQASVDYVLGL